MSTVYIYGFRGRYSGGGEFDWDSPAIGDVHRFLLFLAQDSDQHDFELAKAEIVRFGVS